MNKIPSDFLGIVLLVVLSVWHGRTDKYGPLWMVLYHLPSTILHEYSHLTLALATFSHPVNFSIVPRREGPGWVLGSVTCNRIGMVSAMLVGFAPAIICIPLAWQVYKLHSLPGYAGVYLCLTAAVPSKADIQVAFSSLIGILFWIAAGIGTWWIWNSYIQ